MVSGDGSPPAGSRSRAPVGVCFESPEARYAYKICSGQTHFRDEHRRYTVYVQAHAESATSHPYSSKPVPHRSHWLVGSSQIVSICAHQYPNCRCVDQVYGHAECSVVGNGRIAKAVGVRRQLKLEFKSVSLSIKCWNIAGLYLTFNSVI